MIKKRGAKCIAPAGGRGSEKEGGGREEGERGRGSLSADSQEVGEVREAREKANKGLKLKRGRKIVERGKNRGNIGVSDRNGC